MDNATELLTIRHNKGFDVHGQVVGTLNEIPMSLSYQVKTDDRWNVREVSLVSDGLQLFEVHYRKVEDKWFDARNQHIAEFDGADDIDITVTPFTNTLPIRRIQLQPSESKDIKVIYFDIADMKVYPAHQRYTNLGNNSYRFEHLDTEFLAILEVDDEGFVMNYPGLFKMVYPAAIVAARPN